MEPVVPISLHALFGVASVLLALVAAWKIYVRYEEHGNLQIRDFAFVYAAIGVDTLFLVMPALLWRPELLPPFLALSSFFFFVGLAFYFRLLAQFIAPLQRWGDGIFAAMIMLAAASGIGTYLSDPFMELDAYGWARYHFPGFLDVAYLVFAVFITSIATGTLFLFRGLRSEDSEVRRKGFLLAIALLLVGGGILLALIGDTIVYNFFVLAAFCVFFFAAFSRGRQGD